MRWMAVTDAMLVSSNVPENDHPAYNPATPYPAKTRVRLDATHYVYENTLEGATGKDPATNPNIWVRVRATNRWRLFDAKNSSVTAQANTISYVFKPGAAVPMVAALGLVNCFSIQVRIIDPDHGLVRDVTISPAPRMVRSNWWEFYFGERIGGTSIALFEGLPSYPNALLHVDLVGGPGLSIGLLVFGQPRTWGFGVRWGARVGRKIYSRNEENDFGDFDLLKLPSAKRASFDLDIDNEEVDPLLSYLSDIDADICLFIAARRFEALVIAGIFRNHDVQLENETESTLQIQLLGITK